MFILDTSAWIEFFMRSDEGTKVKKHLEEGNCYTSIASVAEISNWATKENMDGKRLMRYVADLSRMLGLTMEISFLAGELNFQRKKTEENWGMMDSFVLASSKINNLKILTKDSHFKDLPNAEIL